MELEPGLFMVYWTSKYTGGSSKGYTTPMYKPNMQSFSDLQKAKDFYLKMVRLSNLGAIYRGRLILTASVGANFAWNQ